MPTSVTGSSRDTDERTSRSGENPSNAQPTTRRTHPPHPDTATRWTDSVHPEPASPATGSTTAASSAGETNATSRPAAAILRPRGFGAAVVADHQQGQTQAHPAVGPNTA